MNISIYGDSISTLDRYQPDGYDIFYESINCKRSNVYIYKDTWWGQVIDALDGKLLKNNSYSGSCVSSYSKAYPFPCGCSSKRLQALGDHPDMILVYLGFNDWAQGISLSLFQTCYKKMMSSLKQLYPNAIICGMTLCTTYVHYDPTFIFPKAVSGIHIEAYNKTMHNICKELNIHILDLYKYNIPYDTIDGSHPNNYGMKTLAELVLKELRGVLNE